MVLLIIATVGAAAIILSLLSKVLRRNTSQKAKSECIVEGIPVLPGRHWLYGHKSEFTGRAFFDSALQSGYLNATKDGLASCWFGMTPLVVVANPKYARIVLQSTVNRKSSPVIRRHLIRFLGPKTILYLNGKEWKFYRSAVHRAFTPAALKGALKVMSSVSRTLSGSLQRRIDESENGSIKMDIVRLLNLATLDIFCLAALDKDLGGCKLLEPPPLAQAFDYLASEMARRIRSPLNPFLNYYSIPTKSNFRHAREIKSFRELLQGVVQVRKDEMAANSTIDGCRTDLLSHLLSAAEAQMAADPTVDSDMSNETFSNILTTLLVAGSDTTAITVSYAIHCLAKHPQAEKRCVEEVLSVLGEQKDSNDEDAAVTEAPFDIEKLAYCRAVVLETLRLYPPVTASNRCIEKSIKLGDVVIPKKTQVFVAIWAIQRDESVFPRPDEFLPERWVMRSDKNNGSWVERSCGISEMETSSRRCSLEHTVSDDTDDDKSKNEEDDDDTCVPRADPNNFFTFSSGARSCVGKKFAMQEAISVIAVLLKELKFESIYPEYEIVPSQRGLVQKPLDDLPMIIRKRKL